MISHSHIWGKQIQGKVSPFQRLVNENPSVARLNDQPFHDCDT